MFFCLFLGVLGQADAFDGPVSGRQSQAARAKTLQSLQAMQRGRWEEARNLAAAARDPLASKIYFWMAYRKNKEMPTFTRLEQLVRSSPDWPGMGDLIAQAEEVMPDQMPPGDVIAWFGAHQPQTAKGIDQYMQALIITGHEKQARAFLAKWWGEIRLSRDDQKQIYRKYGGYLDRAAHRRRLDTLLFSDQYGNARAIANVLGPGYPELTEARIALAEDKGDVGSLVARVPAALQGDAGLLYERLRWRRIHDQDAGAIQILKHQPASSQITNPEDWWKERHIMIRRLLEEHDFKGAYALASDHLQKEGVAYADAEWMSGWLALRFNKTPTKAYEHFEAMFQKVSTPISKARGAYWAGLAAEEFGQKELSSKWFQEAAQYQTVFYGQIAGAKLGLENALPNAAPPKLMQEDIDGFNTRDMIQAARLFEAAGMKREAGQFLKAFVKSEKTAKAYRFTAELAAELKHYKEAVSIAKDATSEGLFLTAQSYPVISDKLRNVSTEWALIHALIRQESMFDEEAESPAGALGLMQMMPGTAKEVARKAGFQYSPGRLTQADYNIKVGTRYLQQVLERFGGSYPLAIAAYNAGPSRVDKWIDIFGDPRLGQVDLIDWIELIPIAETRNYVQRVMEGVYVYRLRLRGIQKNPTFPIHIALN